jgi:hypothetical protein
MKLQLSAEQEKLVVAILERQNDALLGAAPFADRFVLKLFPIRIPLETTLWTVSNRRLSSLG